MYRRHGLQAIPAIVLHIIVKTYTSPLALTQNVSVARDPCGAIRGYLVCPHRLQHLGVKRLIFLRLNYTIAIRFSCRDSMRRKVLTANQVAASYSTTT